MTNLQPVDFKAVAAKGAYVYCYLRSNGSPYYIGIANNAGRPLRIGRNLVQNTIRPIPGRPELIRLMRSGLAWEEAAQWEKFYIAHYGRKDLGTGILRNRTAGGDGCVEHGPEALRKMRKAFGKASKASAANHHARMAVRYGVSVEFWVSLDQEARRKVCVRYAEGVRGPEIFNNDRNFGLEKSIITKAQRSAKTYGLSVHQWMSFDYKFRAVVKARYEKGVRGESLIASRIDTAERAAEKYGVSFASWTALADKERRAFRMWWKRNGGGTLEMWQVRRNSISAA